MKQHINRIFSLTLALLLCVGIFAAPVFAAESGGSCGKDVTWKLQGGTLIISGSGPMYDYSEYEPAPWQSYKDSIFAVVVESGVSSIGDCAFLQMDKINSVTLAYSVKLIGDWAFSSCYDLTMLDMQGVEQIGECAFEFCRSIPGVRFPNTLCVLGYRAFYGCSSLVSITVPASVFSMGSSVFAYCRSLKNATVLAGISELPSWTFYHCDNLAQVTLAPTIVLSGFEAFYECEIQEPSYGHVGQDTQNSLSTEQTEDGTVITNTSVTENKNATVVTQLITTKNEDGKTEEAVINAILEDKNGWNDVVDKIGSATAGSDSVTIDVWLKGDTTVSGDDLARFADKDIRLTIHTNQGAEWSVNGSDLVAADLANQYDLSFTFTEIVNPNDEQAEILNGQKGYTLVFHGSIDFKVEVELPVGQNYSRQSAVFFAQEDGDYQRQQAVMIDDAGLAHFYLGQVQPEEEYLIGINVPQTSVEGDGNSVSDVIVPPALQGEYPQVEQIEEIEYVITGTKSSWNMNFGQVSLILAAVMIGSVIVIGVVVSVVFKRKLKRGYTPDMSYADDEE